MFAGILVIASVLSAVSPDGHNEIRLETENGLRYSVWRNGKALLSPASISLSVKGHPFAATVQSSEPFTLSGSLETPLYKKASVSLAAKGCRIRLAGSCGIELVARNDGVAYRFVTDFPEDEVIVENESAPIVFSDGKVSVWAGYPDVFQDADKTYSGLSNWEPVYTNLTAAEAGLKTDRMGVLPLVAEYADGTCLSITESDQRDYPGWVFRGSGEAGRLDGWFPREPVEDKCTGPYHIASMTRHDYIARTAGRRTYPWRLFQIAPCAAKLCEGDAVYALAEPCRLTDTSWIKPGLAQWEWWHSCVLSGVPFKSGINTETYLHYVDFAAEHGVPYVVMDGGWSKDYKIMNAKPEIDLKKIAGYAVGKGVGIILWSPWAAFLGCQEEACRRYAEIGIKGFKLDGICRNDRFLTKYLEETARIAAKYKLVIDYHGVSKPSGLSRTYPNVLTFEGVHGLENTKWEGDFMPICDFPKCDLTDYFCRMTAGPMDYTPGSMRNFATNEYHYSFRQPGSQGTRVRQMAMFTMFESPLQMLCDSPSAYRREAECFAFISKVPTVWDETIGLDGKLARHALVARRKDDVWYVGAMTDWSGLELAIPTDFLKSGSWSAEIFADGPNADRDATDYVRTVRTIRAGEKLKVRLAPGGGWTARLTRSDACGEPSFPLVTDGRPVAAFELLSTNASLRADIDLFNRHLRQVTQAALPVGGDSVRKIVFRLSEQKTLEERYDWKVMFPAPDRMEIEATATSAFAALLWILEEGADARFLGSEDSMFQFEPRKDVLVTIRPRQSAARSFNLYRGVYYLKGHARELGVSDGFDEGKGAFEFTHGIPVYAFPAAKYNAEGWPEAIMPTLKDGSKLKRPGGNPFVGWQPCYSSPESARIAIENILAYLAEHPDKKSVSLGVNDFGGYCLCPSCKSLDEASERPIFTNERTSFSRSYYTFVNRVAEAVGKARPDVVIGLLAYTGTIMPPDFPMAKNIVPMMTFDVYAAAPDPAVIAQQEDIIRRWERLVGRTGTWAYGWGQPFVVPRVNPEAEAHRIKFLYEHGGRAYFAERSNSDALDGPKTYLEAKLLADVDADPKTLLDEWYVRYAGKDAEDALRKLYALCEGYWSSARMKQSWFWEERGYIYVQPTPERQYSHLTALTPGFTRQLLALANEVHAKARTPGEKRRAEILVRNFERLDCRAMFYGSAWGDPRTGRPTTAAAAAGMLNELADWSANLMAQWKRVCDYYDNPDYADIVGDVYPAPTDYGAHLINQVASVAPFAVQPEVARALARVAASTALPEDVRQLAAKLPVGVSAEVCGQTFVRPVGGERTDLGIVWPKGTARTNDVLCAGQPTVCVQYADLEMNAESLLWYAPVVNPEPGLYSVEVDVMTPSDGLELDFALWRKSSCWTRLKTVRLQPNAWQTLHDLRELDVQAKGGRLVFRLPNVKPHQTFYIGGVRLTRLAASRGGKRSGTVRIGSFLPRTCGRLVRTLDGKRLVSSEAVDKTVNFAHFYIRKPPTTADEKLNVRIRLQADQTDKSSRVGVMVFSKGSAWHPKHPNIWPMQLSGKEPRTLAFSLSSEETGTNGDNLMILLYRFAGSGPVSVLGADWDISK